MSLCSGRDSGDDPKRSELLLSTDYLSCVQHTPVGGECTNSVSRDGPTVTTGGDTVF